MSLQELLAELQKNYLASLPEKITNLENLWKSNQIDLLETEYHKLKGTGRTYGLPEVTQLGAAMERLCESAPDNTDILARSVPSSIKILNRIRDQRIAGETPSLDTDPDFQAIVAIVENMDKASK